MNTAIPTFLAFGAPGLNELIVILLVVLLLFGAKKIPELARGVGKGMGELKKARKELESDLNAGECDVEREWTRPRDNGPAEAKPDSDLDAAVEPATLPPDASGDKAGA